MALPARILVVDDEAAHRLMIGLHLKEAGYDFLEAAHGQEALDLAAQEPVDLVILDIRMPVLDGQQTLVRLKERQPDLPVLMMTAFGSIEDAVKALKAGAWDYLTKPLDAEEMVIKVGQALEVKHLAEENRAHLERLGERFDFKGLVGRSPAMVKLVNDLRLIAPSEASVMILGASGTGKEVVANIIHHNSPRQAGPFVKVNCAALPETLLEAELFGHEKGAFTGAAAKRLGRFASAEAGTIFLDEVGSMPPATQAKLLRVLQEKEIEPLGQDRPVPVDVRVLAATNADLAQETAAGRFREDLFYRLNVVTVKLPLLKDRAEDIPLLAEHFLKLANDKNNRQVQAVSQEALKLLVAFDWPGNVRQLANVIERGVVLCPGQEISPTELPAEIRGGGQAGGWFKPGATLKEAERALIEWTLVETNGNRTQAAQELAVSRKTLQNKIKEYGLQEIGLEPDKGESDGD
ncbi:MAG: sigma-54-dependent Fis family transcriptional regulator [Deltaproteobacteria bacterium]|nr:sigma-54-dependent Fis family transcriptional regulator [Deltaproteobacteria bacterium]